MRAHDGEPRSGDGRVVLAGARVVTPAGTLRSGWVAVQGGVIAALGQGLPAADGAPVQDLSGAWLVPGFVDMHVHGGGGAWLASLDPEEVDQAVRFHLGKGTTSMLASIATSPLGSMLRSAAVVAGAAAGPLAPALAGIHLEGPFISRERSGGLDLVRQIARSGAVPAVGHTQAGYEAATAAIDAGVRVSTHLFNAMPGLHHRDLGTVGAALSRGEVICELVNDGVHLRPEVVRLVFQAAGAERVALVTDAIAAAGMADGDYDFGRVPLRVRGGVARLVDGRTIAGSTLTMDAALRRAVQGDRHRGAGRLDRAGQGGRPGGARRRPRGHRGDGRRPLGAPPDPAEAVALRHADALIPRRRCASARGVGAARRRRAGSPGRCGGPAPGR